MAILSVDRTIHDRRAWNLWGVGSVSMGTMVDRLVFSL